MLKIEILGDAPTAFIRKGMSAALESAAISAEILEHDIAQIAAQLLNAESELHRRKPDWTALYESGEVAREQFWLDPAPETWADRRLANVRAYAQNAPGQLIYLVPPQLTDGAAGSGGLAAPSGLEYQCGKFRFGLMELARELPNLHLVDLAAVESEYGRGESFPSAMWAAQSMTLGVAAARRAGERAAQIVAAHAGAVRKVLVLDLDNTCWGGIVGDDGVENLRLGELGNGRAHTALQKWAKALTRRGVMLAACSKNELATAQLPFREHPEMILKLEDFASFKANWNPKPDNLRAIAAELNVGLESFVFLDDRRIEREEMRAALPMVAVPELPDDPAEWIEFLARGNWFETATLTAADASRAESMRARAAAEAAALNFASREEFLASLEMKVSVEGVTPFNAPRAAQLTQRANQFNLRMSRLDADELLARAADPARWQCFAFGLKDKFADHGLVGFAALRRDGAAAAIETWVMSCRAAGRGLEARMMDELERWARNAGLSELRGEYVRGPRNAPVANLLAGRGFVDGVKPLR